MLVQLEGSLPHAQSARRFLDAVRAIRPYLPELLTGEDSARYERDITELLRLVATDPDGSRERLDRLLRGNPATRQWMRLVLADPLLRPPDVQDWEERGVPALGSGLPVPAKRYVCPVDGNFARYQRVAGEDMGDCPDHGLPLVEA